MRRVLLTSIIACLLLGSTPVHARDGRPVRMTLAAGIAGSTASEVYDGLMVLPGGALTVGSGIAMPIAGPVWGFFDVNYARIGRGVFLGRTTWVNPVMEPSSVATAMIGSELSVPDSERPEVFVSGAIGVGRVLIGDMNSSQMSGTTTTRHQKPELAPAFSMGIGVRIGSAGSRVHPVVGLHWVSVFTDGASMSLVPLTIGLAF